MTNTKVDPPLPCPFCGSAPKDNGHPNGIMGQIYCGSDDCFGPRTSAGLKEDSVKQWNTRAPQPSLPEPAGLREAVAYRWKPKGSAPWIYNSEADWLVTQDIATIDVEPLYAAPQPPAPKKNLGSPEWDRAIKAVSQPPAPVGGREGLAETIHKARWPADRTMAITPFADEDKNGREYCFRIADAILAAVTPTAPISDRAAVIEAHKAFNRMLRKEIIEECARVADATAVTAGKKYGASESAGALMAARRIRTLTKDTQCT